MAYYLTFVIKNQSIKRTFLGHAKGGTGFAKN